MKQTIEEAAKDFRGTLIADVITLNAAEYFIKGAYSQAAKEYHTQGMYSKDEMIDFAVFYYTHQGTGDEYWGRDLFKVWKDQKDGTKGTKTT